MDTINNTGNLGKVLYKLPEVTSTNSYAQELIAKNAPVEGTVILAEHQSRGRGQTGNVWDSAPGMNVLMSVILKPMWLPITDQFYLNMAVALAVREVVQALVPKETIQVKWPNDILVNGEKVAGILIENMVSGHKINHSVVGIGVNVNQQQFAEDVKRATSLKLASGRTYEVGAMAEKMVNGLDGWYERLKLQNFSAIKSDYLSHLFRYQEQHSFRVKGTLITAQIIGINPLGKLVLEQQGALKEYWMQEVEYVYE